MDVREAAHFLSLIGAENIRVDESRGWARCSCPLSAWRHESGRDSKPSFGIHTQDTEPPYFYCFACEATGPLPKLLHDLYLYTGKWYKEASAFLSRFVLFKDDREERARLGDARTFTVEDKFASSRYSRRSKANEALPDFVVGRFPLLSEESDDPAHQKVLKWLIETRKISLQSIAKYQLRLYVSPLDDIGVIFPIIGRNQKPVDLWVRLVDEKKNFRLTGQLLGIQDFKASNMWFGIHAADLQKPVLLVEGALDAMRLDTLGVDNVLASFGAPSNEQIEALYAPVVYLGYDNDGAGANFSRKLVDKLQVPALGVLDWNVVGIKDAGELESMAQFKMVVDECSHIIKSMKKSVKLEKLERKLKILSKETGKFI